MFNDINVTENFQIFNLKVCFLKINANFYISKKGKKYYKK
jgi:hypothetical protein